MLSTPTQAANQRGLSSPVVAPDLGRGPLSERLSLFARQHESFRRAVVNEPRGSDVLVGALFQEPW